MAQEYSLVRLSHSDTLLKNASCHITNQNGLNINLEQEINKQNTDIIGRQIIDNLLLLEKNLLNEFTESVLNIVNLCLNNSQLNDLPNSLNMLRNLIQLNLENNEFTYLPNVVCELSNLKRLYASKNRIKQVPNKLGNLLNLEILDLSVNRLTDLPNSCAKLNHVEYCYLDSNRFKRIPNCIAKGMKNLKFFTFCQNLCSELNVYPKSIEVIQFHANRNGNCPSFPKWILSSKYKKLEVVSLDKTRFQNFNLPKKSFISYVKKLSINQCYLNHREVEKIITGMMNLESLIIGNENKSITIENRKIDFKNNFCTIPIATKKRPSSLEELHISNTGLVVVPKIINKFVNLFYINISSNCLSLLPEEICTLKNLTKLIADKNNLEELPENIGELTSLKQLKLCHNRLHKLPNSMESLHKLEYLDLYNNNFEIIPELIWRLKSLVGLDIEQNYVSTEYLLLTRNMRETLRAHWSHLFDCKSACGPKLKPSPNHKCGSSILSSIRKSFSSLSSTSESNLSREEQDLELLPQGTYNELMNERWDTSEDSADEFDPNEYKEPKRFGYSPFTFYKPFQRVYCPGDYHPSRVVTRVVEMLRKGTLIWQSNYEEGQFEDP
ncbi:PREDICTED: leucine-rich repeat protein SHOC-2-like [Habropoda laboriosa]|uniref:leucine-rich repeat protein SHOC-2-like n=1 Tax=Habropoda laboriosa TaxID=597456 RepID=UPI00083D402A|nr:PREDICTED: leucine-rich repeat protein SHOC-2-like [Habropoda laboriosa]